MSDTKFEHGGSPMTISECAAAEEVQNTHGYPKHITVFNVAGKLFVGRHAQEESYTLTSAIREASQTEVSDWQPIETAPRDGTKIFIYPTHGHHSKGNEPRATIGYWWEPSNLKYKGKWITWVKVSNATHWMPLPKPPDGRG